MSIYFLWFFVSLFTHKFILELQVSFFKMIIPFIRSYFIILSVFSVIIFGFRIEGLSRLLLFGTVLSYSFGELFILFSIFMYRYIQKSDIPEINVFEAPLLHEDIVVKGIISREHKKEEKYFFPGHKKDSGQFYEKLSKVYLKNSPEILDSIKSTYVFAESDTNKITIMLSTKLISK